MTTTTRARRIAGAAALVPIAMVLARVAWLVACGPDVRQLDTIAGSVHPGSIETYRRGDLGVIRPHFARRYLVQAYRVLNGTPALENAVPHAALAKSSDANTIQAPSGYQQWFDALQRYGVAALAPGAVYESRLSPGTYQSFVNCHDDAFKVAAKTLAARSERFGPGSVAVREWTQAQAAVFANCNGEKLVLPASPSSDDPLVRADSEYQTAAAYFYATEYEEAATRFRRIAGDAASPWQHYGQYLAARATIRLATVPDHDTRHRDELLASAAAQLQEVLRDSRAAALHASARGLLDFIDARLHELEHLASLASRVSGAPAVTDQQLADYRRLMDRLVGDTVEFSYDAVPNVSRVAATHEINDWILATQGSGDAGLARALSRWQETRSPLWLVAVLWKLPSDHAAAAAVLDAAAAIQPPSPAYPTVTYLRIRLLLDRGNRREARSLLATLPDRPARGFDIDGINLLDAARFRSAESFDELLARAVRIQLPSRCFIWETDCLKVDNPIATFDDDAGATFTTRLPLALLVEAARRPTLPDRLRVRVAAAAFTRAFVLQRNDAIDPAARALRDLAPAMRVDLDAFLGAADAEEKTRLGVLLLLRTPGLHAYVRGRDDELSAARTEPSRRFDHMYRQNWWCAAQVGPPDERLSAPGGWGLLGTLYTDGRWPDPAFLTDAQRVATSGELRALAAIGSPQGYLAERAIDWARARPTDLRAAEALALAVEGGRWSCSVSESSRRAFQTLHRLFPQNEWAKRTKYWYEGWPEA